jgi:hypothetical protein
MKHVIWRNFGGPRVLFAVEKGRHAERVKVVAEQFDRPLEGRYALVAHTGFGVEQWLPRRHSYSAFTVLRDPVQRTISHYFYGRDRTLRGEGGLPIEMSLDEYLSEVTIYSFNCQTSFLSGLQARHQVEGEPLDRSRFDRGLLEQAKRNLETHSVVGLTERFDETLLLLRETYGWPLRRVLYLPANVGVGRRSAPPLSERELEAIRANNELDIELYEYAQDLFQARLSELIPDHERQLKRYRSLNDTYRRTHPLIYPPARAIARSARRLKSGASLPASS